MDRESDVRFLSFDCKSPSDYISLDIRKGVSIYRQFEENPEIFLYVPNPALKAEVWRDFEP